MNALDLIRDISKSKKILQDNDKRADRTAVTFGATFRAQDQRKKKLDELKHKMIEGDASVYQEWKDLIYEILTTAMTLALMEKLREEIAAETRIEEERLKQMQMTLELELAGQVKDIVQLSGLDKLP